MNVGGRATWAGCTGDGMGEWECDGVPCVVLTCDRQHKRSHAHSSAQCGHLPRRSMVSRIKSLSLSAN